VATVKRKIFYYKTRVRAESASFTDMLRKVSKLDVSERVYDYAGQQTILETFWREDHVLGKITILREDGLPSIGTRNTLVSRPIDLRDNEGIQEVSHFVFLPAKSLLAFEYNHPGPRVTVLFKAVNDLYNQYFTNPNNTPVIATFDYIDRGGTLDRIDHAKGIKAIEATFTTAQLSTNNNAGLIKTIHQISDIGQTKTISIVLKGEKGSRNPIMGVSDLVNKFLPNREQSLPDFDKLRVKIINPVGAVEVIDLFEDKVIAEINAIKIGRSRALDSADLYEKVLEDARSKARDMG
jgi:hypothetical protein